MLDESYEYVLVLLSRLERISADSSCAHLASGIRGALLKLLSQIEIGKPVDFSDMDKLVDQGFDVLEKSLSD